MGVVGVADLRAAGGVLLGAAVLLLAQEVSDGGGLLMRCACVRVNDEAATLWYTIRMCVPVPGAPTYLVGRLRCVLFSDQRFLIFFCTAMPRPDCSLPRLLLPPCILVYFFCHVHLPFDCLARLQASGRKGGCQGPLDCYSQGPRQRGPCQDSRTGVGHHRARLRRRLRRIPKPGDEARV